jgi:signal transduction histidine kinase/CheY-like chemotaxis protein
VSEGETSASRTLPGPSEGPIARLWERLVAPSPQLPAIADQMRARLLAGLLLVVVVAGFVSGLIQLALIPGFLTTFLTMNGALAVLAAGYLASRTRHYRVGGALAALAPLLACVLVGAMNPDDRVWYAFLSIGVLLSSIFLSLGTTTAVAVLSFLAILLLAALVPELRRPERLIPPLAFQAVFSPLLLVAARHRNRREEAERHLQDQLLSAHKLESVGRLAGGVAHDFNNMLAVILGTVGLMKERRVDDAELAKELEDIERAAEHARDVTRQLLAFSRKQVRAPQSLALNDHLARTRKTLARLIGENIRLELHTDPGLWLVRMDPSQVDQIIINLAANARDAMPGGGQITIETANVHLDGASNAGHAGARPGDYVRLSVTDTGVGMDAETLSRIFEPFFTTKAVGMGTGLGLATVYGIVTQNGGLIRASSEPGRGTRVTIHFPRVVEAGAQPERLAPPLRSLEGTILVVEDEELVRRVTAEMLRALGLTVLVAASGREALDHAARPEQPIDLMLTDVVMPEMGGPALRDRIWQLRPGLPVVFMSGHARDVIGHHGALGEGVQLIQKPFTMDDLARALQEARPRPR